MKKLLTFLLLSFLITTKLLAVTTPVTITTSMTTTDVNTAITTAKATNTDITLQFACGSTFNYAGSALTIPTGVTKLTFAATGTGNRPVINLDQIIYSDALMTDGLFFDGVQLYSLPANSKTLYQPTSATSLPAKLSINNCWVEGYKVVFYLNTASTLSNVTLTNSTFYNIGGGGGTPSGIISTSSTALVNSISITNNTFIDCHTGSRYFMDHRTTNITNATFDFSNNTCYYSVAQSSNGALRLGASPASTGKYTFNNNIISLSASVTAAAFKFGYTTGYSNLGGTGNYYSGNFNAVANPFTVTFTQYNVAPTTLFTSPGTTTSANFTINDPNFTAKITAGNGNCFYPETVLLNGGSSNITLSTLSYLESAGPSSSTSFTISAYVPRSVITLQAPSNFEISKDNSTFSSSLTVGAVNTDLASTVIYVRLIAGLTNASSPYSGNITVTTTTGTSKTVGCSGTVTTVSLPQLNTPTNVSATLPVYTGSFHASWTGDANALNYTVKIYGTPAPTLTGITATSTDITGLTQGNSYTFTVTAIGNGTTYSNSVESSPSGSVTIPTNPTVSSLTPASGTTIPISGSISVVFSENVTRNSLNDITLGGVTISESNIAVSGSTVTINYSGLSYNSISCPLTIPAGAFKSNSTGTPTVVATTATYKTPDNIPPTLTKMSIGNGATLPVNGFISLVMSEPCIAGSASITLGSKTITAAVSASNNNLLYINYSGLAFDTDYTLTIPTNSITDLSGNSYTGTTVTFHTEVDAKGTQLFSFTPDATSVPGTSSGTVTQTINSYMISFDAVLSAGARSASPYTYAFKTNSVTLPTLPSVGELTFYIQSGGGTSQQEYYIQKLAADGVTWNTIETFILGNNDKNTVKSAAAQSSVPTTLRLMYNSSNLWFYTISASAFTLNGPVDDGFAPSVVSTVPAASASNVVINGNLKLTYSKSLVMGSGNITLNGVTLTPGVIGANVTLPYANLKYSTSYTLSVPAGAFNDLFSRPCSAFSLTFTTVAKPAVTPKVFDFVVAQDGSGNGTTIQSAFDAVPLNNATPFLIFVKNGTYNEYPSLASTKDNVSLIGQSRDAVVITGSHYSGLGGYTTSTCQTVEILSKNLYCENITVQNTAGVNAGQAVALKVYGDKNVFKNVKLVGYQDTHLTSNIGTDRQYYLNCDIRGSVDYIFGNGACFFDNCLLYMQDRATADVVCAPSTSVSNTYGYVFNNCTIDGASSQDGIYDLGRPWQNSPRAVYLNTKMNILAASAGWISMSTIPALFAEYATVNAANNPVNLSARNTSFSYTDASSNLITGSSPTAILSATDAANYTLTNVLGGADSWDATLKPQTTASAANLVVTSGNLRWDVVDGAICYIVLKDGQISNITTSNSVSAAIGTYDVIAVSEFGALSAKSSLSVTDLGTGLIGNTSKFPALKSTVIQQSIEITNAETVKSVELLTLNGQLIQNFSGNVSNLKVNGLQSGFYMLNMYLTDGKRISVKLIKE